MLKPVRGKDSHFVCLSSWDSLVPGGCKSWISLLQPESGTSWWMFRGRVKSRRLSSWEKWMQGFLEEADLTLNKEEQVLWPDRSCPLTCFPSKPRANHIWPASTGSGPSPDLYLLHCLGSSFRPSFPFVCGKRDSGGSDSLPATLSSLPCVAIVESALQVPSVFCGLFRARRHLGLVLWTQPRFTAMHQGFIPSEVSPKQGEGGSFLELEFTHSLWESLYLQQSRLWLQACRQGFPAISP